MILKLIIFRLPETVLQRNDISSKEHERRRYDEQMCRCFYAFLETELIDRAALQADCHQVLYTTQIRQFCRRQKRFCFSTKSTNPHEL